jgi:nitrogen fixation NifU-like protein
VYSDTVIEYFNNPRNVGSLDESAAEVGTGIAAAEVCGDVLKLQIRVGGGEAIEEAKFKVFGCPASIAAGSLATEWITGKAVEEAAQLEIAMLAERLELTPAKMECAVLAADAVKAAVQDWKRKNADMIRYKVTFEPAGVTVRADPSAYPYGRQGEPGSLLDIALSHGVGIQCACGGTGVCGTCRVIVESGMEDLSEPTEDELDTLQKQPDHTPNCRLACQAVVSGDVTVRVPR